MNHSSFRTITLITATVGSLTWLGAATANASPLENAQVGNCMHVDEFPGEGQTIQVHYSYATCGTGYASIVVTAVVTDPSQCPGTLSGTDSNGRTICFDRT